MALLLAGTACSSNENNSQDGSDSTPTSESTTEISGTLFAPNATDGSGRVTGNTWTDTTGAAATTQAGFGSFEDAPSDQIGFERATVQPSSVGLKLGQVVQFEYHISNAGTSALSSPSVQDSVAGSVPCDQKPLGPGAFVICRAKYAVKQQDIDAGMVKSEARAFAVANKDKKRIESQPETVTIDLARTAKVSLRTQAIVPRNARAGAIASYVYSVRNDGNVTLSQIVVQDDRLAAIKCASATVAPGATVVCRANEPLTQAVIDAGTRSSNPVVVGSTSAGEAQASAVMQLTVAQRAEMKVAPEQVAAPTAAAAGDQHTAKFVVSNTGNVTLSNVSAKENGLFCVDNGPPPGAKLKCTATRTLDQTDVDAGSFEWVATISGTGPSGQVITLLPARARLTVIAQPAMTVAKEILPANGPYAVGQEINQSYIVVNKGNVTLRLVSVTDALAPTVQCPPEPLRPGDQSICRATRALTAADLAPPTWSSIVQASATPPKGDPVRAEVTFAATLSTAANQ